MENKREPIWWPPLLRRVLVWGLAMAALWIAPFPLLWPLVLVALPLVRWTPALSVSLGVCAVLGFVTGACCAFFAPPTDAANPMKSHVFKAAGLDTAFFFFTVGGGLNALINDPSVVKWINRFIPASALEIVVWLVVFALGLWLALYRALRAAKLK